MKNHLLEAVEIRIAIKINKTMQTNDVCSKCGHTFEFGERIHDPISDSQYSILCESCYKDVLRSN